MNDFEFYKKRGFKSLLNDTFSFFRQYAGNYFSNYLLINGGIILLVGAILAPLFVLYGNLSGDNENITLLITIPISFLLVFLAVFILCFPIAYTQMLEKNMDGTTIKSKALFVEIRGMLPRAFSFSFSIIFVLFFSFFLLLTFIYRVLYPINPILFKLVFVFLITLFIILVHQLMLVYIKDKQGFFPSLGIVLMQLKEGFWGKVGATFVILLIIYMFVYAALIIPIFIFTLSTEIVGIGLALENSLLVFALLLIVITVFFVVYNFLTFLQILIYLGGKEGEHTDEIDLIGQNEEE